MSHGDEIHWQVAVVLLMMASCSMEKATWYVNMAVQALSLECPTFVLTSVLMKIGHLRSATLLIISLDLLKVPLQLALQEDVGFLH